MKKIKNFLQSPYIRLGLYVLCIIAGGVLITAPHTSLITLCYIGSAVLAYLGITKILGYIRSKHHSPNTLDAVSGGILLTVSLALLIHPKFLMSVIPFLIGICVVVYGLSGILSNRKSSSLFSKILSVITVIYGASLIFNPFKGATSVVSMVGFGLLAYGIIRLVITIPLLRTKPKSLPSDDGYIEVDFKDV